jgi:hypothetical protein
VPAPSLQEFKTALEIASAEYPQAKNTDPYPIFDASFVGNLEQSGFIKSIYKK